MERSGRAGAVATALKESDRAKQKASMAQLHVYSVKCPAVAEASAGEELQASRVEWQPRGRLRQLQSQLRLALNPRSSSVTARHMRPSATSSTLISSIAAVLSYTCPTKHHLLWAVSIVHHVKAVMAVYVVTARNRKDELVVHRTRSPTPPPVLDDRWRLVSTVLQARF